MSTESVIRETNDLGLEPVLVLLITKLIDVSKVDHNQEYNKGRYRYLPRGRYLYYVKLS
jgi:hypothetical protein